MTPIQLRMAIAAAGIRLCDLASETGTYRSQISNIQTGRSGAHNKTMQRLEAAFTKRGIRFEQRAGEVVVVVPESFVWHPTPQEEKA
jgi:transcriptional regulator with XRE-family HTH domain